MLIKEQIPGQIFVVSAPAGTGKTTLVQMLIREFPSVVLNISYTTRQPRKGEVEGVDYHFVEESVFLQKMHDGDFLEYVKLYDTYYGTSREWINQKLREGKHVVLVIDTQGALQIKKKMKGTFIFLKAPSLEVLHHRLLNRQTESLEMIEKRLIQAEEELKVANQYDYEIVNDDLMTAYQVLKSIMIAESHRIEKS